MSYRELARAALVSPSTVQAIGEARSPRVSVAVLWDLARALRVSPAWLAFGVGDP